MMKVTVQAMALGALLGVLAACGSASSDGGAFGPPPSTQPQAGQTDVPLDAAGRFDGTVEGARTGSVEGTVYADARFPKKLNFLGSIQGAHVLPAFQLALEFTEPLEGGTFKIVDFDRITTQVNGVDGRNWVLRYQSEGRVWITGMDLVLVVTDPKGPHGTLTLRLPQDGVVGGEAITVTLRF